MTILLLIVMLGTSLPARAQAVLLQFHSDGLVVYDENASTAPDMTGDTWAFDRDKNGGADLIIRFRLEPALTAYVYDDLNNNQQIDYLVGASEVQILEPHWRVRVVARDGQWTLGDGRPNWNLEFAFDSGFEYRMDVPPLSFAGCPPLQSGRALELLDQSDDPLYGTHKVDGTLDFSYRYWDQNQDGSPDIALHTVHAIGNGDTVLFNPSSALIYSPELAFPPLDTILSIDWQAARVRYVRGLIPPPQRFSGYSADLFPFAEGDVVAHERQLIASYDFANDGSCTPELNLRVTAEEFDPVRPQLIAYNDAVYNWSHGSQGRYRLHLLGRVWDDTIMDTPFYPVAQIPYTELSGFMADQVWRGAVLSEIESNQPVFLENDSYLKQARTWLLSGGTSTLPRYIPPQLYVRDEYNFSSFNREPVLYLGSVDQRLHLAGAENGIIIYRAATDNPALGTFSNSYLADSSLSVDSSVEYEDGDGDGYIDTWTLIELNRIVRTLVLRSEFAAFIEDDTVLLKKLPYGFRPATWQAQIPTNPEAWQIFDSALPSAYQARRELKDLDLIFNDLPGSAISLDGTSVKSIARRSPSLVMHVMTKGYESDAPALNWLALPLGGLPAGEFTLRDNAGGLQFEPFASPKIEISSFAIDGDTIFFEVKNTGGEDLHANVRIVDNLRFAATLYEREFTVPAFGKARDSLKWLPSLPGTRPLQLSVTYRVNDQPAEISAVMENVSLVVDPQIERQALDLQLLQQIALIVIALILIALVAVGVFIFASDKEWVM